MQIFSKLIGFPDSVNIISLKESELRRVSLKKQLQKLGINNIHFTISERYNEQTDRPQGLYIDTICNNGKSTVINHIKNFLHWYNNTSEEYGIFMEDDADLSTIQYWGFTWYNFINFLPSDWECVQLHVVHTHSEISITPVKLWSRRWYDWSAAVFIAKRSYVKKILDNCYQDSVITLKTGFTEPFQPGCNLYLSPCPENIIYSYGKTYTIPLFLEDTGFYTTFTDLPHDKGGHIESHNMVKQWWKENQYTHNIIEMMQP